MTTLASSACLYSGLGNTFLILKEELSPAIAPKLCEKYHVDGVLLALPSLVVDFKMEIINRDGSIADCCGNGLRCLFHYLYHQGSIPASARIETRAGIVSGQVCGDEITVDMPFPKGISQKLLSTSQGTFECYHLNTGVPHLVLLKENVCFRTIAPLLRSHSSLEDGGANVNWVRKVENQWCVTTYERGVEGVTKACGTGMVAAALSLRDHFGLPSPLKIYTEEGLYLTIYWDKNQVTMKGNATKLFNVTLPSAIMAEITMENDHA